MMQDFTILREIPGGHNFLSSRGYPFSHPNCWEATNSLGAQCILISRRDDYMPNIKIKISARQIGSSSIYIDNSPATLLNPTSSTTAFVGEVDSDVILLVHNVQAPTSLKTVVTGEIFYVDPRLKNLQTQSLRDAFQEHAAISVTTHLKPDDFNPGSTYTFASLREVSVFKNVIHATDARALQP